MQNLTQNFLNSYSQQILSVYLMRPLLQQNTLSQDCIGAIVGGMAEKEMQQLLQNLAIRKNGEASLLGDKYKTASQTAAFLNGTAGTFLEMDEGHQFAKGHPAMHIFPALFSAEGKNISGTAFLRAFILGYDVAARIGFASQLNPAMHPHGTWGGLGAASAASQSQPAR